MQRDIDASAHRAAAGAPNAAPPGSAAASVRVPVSCFIITRNEAQRIGRTITAVMDWLDEVVVVDSGSTDDTVAIARSLGARVVHNDWPGYGAQKRFAEGLCRNRWLLNIDADEIVDAKLAAEIRALFAGAEPACDGYRLPIRDVYPGETAPAWFAYAYKVVRLYRGDRGTYSVSPVHDRVDMAPGTRIGHLAGSIHHVSVQDLAQQVAKLNAYSTAQALDAESRGVLGKAALPRLLVEFPLSFLKAYVLRRHVLRGRYGYLIAMNYAFSRHLRLAKMVERRMISRRDGKAGG